MPKTEKLKMQLDTTIIDSQLIIVNTVLAKTQTLCTNYLIWYRLVHNAQITDSVLYG